MASHIPPKVFYADGFDPTAYPLDSVFPARKQLIWLGSFPKSGNTWVRLLLASYMAGGRQVDINSDIDNMAQCSDAFLHALALQERERVTDLKQILIARPRVQRLMARCSRPTIVKTHAYPGTAHGHLVLDPAVTLRSIYLVRHPFDVVLSYARHMSLGLESAVANICNPNLVLDGKNSAITPISSWNNNSIAWYRNRKIFETKIIRYEDLRRDTSGKMQELLKFLEIKIDSKQLEGAMKATSLKKLRAQEAKSGFKENGGGKKGASAKFFGEGKVQGWAGKLPEESKGVIVRASHEAMKKFGYWESKFDQFL